MITISSQDHRDESIILEKIENEDFEVFVSPVFEIDGDEYRVVIDGHHSYEAAIRTGKEPEFVEQSCSDNDTICLLDSGEVEAFLVEQYNGAEWYNIETCKAVW